MTSESFTANGPAGSLAGVDQAPADGGHGLPVLLVHGINMSKDVWTDVADRVAEHRRVVRFDLRGHGESAKEGPFTASDYGDDALAVLDARGIERAHIVGTSFGGSAAASLASRHPERVATIASFGGALSVPELDLDAAAGFLRQVGVRDFFAGVLPEMSFAPGTDPALIERALDSASNGRDVDTVIAVVTAALSADTTATAEAVDAPALVVTGELDKTCPVVAGEAVAKALGTELVVLEQRGHVVSMEVPDEVADLIEAHAAAHDG
jgi:3-oxoadipate enol-lactonase